MNTTIKSLLIAGALLGIPAESFAENYIGIILDGYQHDCIVQNKAYKYNCNEDSHLYAGDMIIKKPDVSKLKIKWAPYAGGRQINSTTLQVFFEPPDSKKRILEKIKDVLGLIKAGRETSIGATRGIEDEIRVSQPGSNATVIPGQKITFIHEGIKGKYIIFKDSTEQDVFRKELTAGLFTQLTPEEIGIKPCEVYTWQISGAKNDKHLRIRLLSKEIAEQVTADIKEIDKENIANAEKVIKKAAYLQFISDAYPDDIDLYWLSYLLIAEIKDTNKLGETDKAIKEEIKTNYMRHIYNMP